MTDDNSPPTTNSQSETDTEEATASETPVDGNPVSEDMTGLTGAGGRPCKIIGSISNPDGIGVYAENTASSGFAYGIKAVTQTSRANTEAIRGEAPSGARGIVGFSQDRIGVKGESRNGRGVYGISDSAPGVYGSTDDGNSWGIEGKNSAINNTTDTGHGVRGVTKAEGDGSAGVFGEASPSSGTVHGVKGVTNSSDAGAAGVYATAPNGGNAITADSTVSVNDRADIETGISNTNATNLQNYPLAVHNTNSDSNGNLVLALKTGTTDDPDIGHNFIQFLSPDGNGGTDTHGSVEGDGSGGVTYETTGADYAEYLPKRDAEESIEAGDVVGVFDNHITQQTDGASRVLVVSDAPNVAGNAPSEDDDADYETVAFTGQVPVKVRGPVSDGDLVVPSGENDGVGVAVAPDEREPGTPIVGQAWDHDDSDGVSEVTVAVGIDDPATSEDALTSVVARQRERIDNLWAENEQLRTELDAKDERIDELEARLTAVEEQMGPTATPADD